MSDAERAARNFAILADYAAEGERRNIPDVLTEIWQQRQWEALNYESFQEACQAIIGPGKWLPWSDVQQRRELVGQMTQQGMSTRAISDTLGVSQTTVVTDRSGEQNRSPDPVSVIGLDGKTYPSPITKEQKQAADDLLAQAEAADPFDGWSAEELMAKQRLDNGQAVVVNMSRDAVCGPRIWAWAEANGLAVRIDRKSRWGNPFILGEDGDRATVIANYRDHYLPLKPALQEGLPELAGMVLGCWCYPLDCHGDILRQACR